VICYCDDGKMFRFNEQFQAICIGNRKENEKKVRNRIKKERVESQLAKKIKK